MRNDKITFEFPDWLLFPKPKQHQLLSEKISYRHVTQLYW